MDPSDRALETLAFERDAEMLGSCQLDLLAQLERQLRAVHHTMRHIDKLRNAAHRVEPELSPVERPTLLTRVEEAIEALDSQLQIEHSCCSHMRDTIIKMQARVADLRRRAPIIAPRQPNRLSPARNRKRRDELSPRSPVSSHTYS